MALASFISFLARHFIQYACIYYLRFLRRIDYSGYNVNIYFLPFMKIKAIYRGKLLMLYRNMVCCQIHVVPYHFQRRVSQYLLQRKYITTINQKPRGERVPAEMSVKPVHA